jgi:hypothetical protein
MGKIIEVKISELKDNFDIRTIINQSHVDYLCELQEGGTDLGPIKITKNFTIIDGLHRVALFRLLEIPTIKAEIVDDDSTIGIIRQALNSNMGGPLPPTKADIRRVMTILITKGYSKKRIYEEFKEVLPVSFIKTSYQYAALKINNRKVQEAIQLINDSNLSKQKAAEMVGIPEDWITKKLSTGITNGEYVQAAKAELSGLFAHFNKRTGKAFSTILQKYDDADATKKDTERVVKYLGQLISNQNRMYADWQKRWNYKK